jgi:hypothetical protein
MTFCTEVGNLYPGMKLICLHLQTMSFCVGNFILGYKATFLCIKLSTRVQNL